MKTFLNTYKLAILGVIIGAIAGYFYWKYVGCITGTCYGNLPYNLFPFQNAIVRSDYGRFAF